MFLEYEVGDMEDGAQELCHIRAYVLPVLNSTCGGIKRFLKQGNDMVNTKFGKIP